MPVDLIFMERTSQLAPLARWRRGDGGSAGTGLDERPVAGENGSLADDGGPGRPGRTDRAPRPVGSGDIVFVRRWCRWSR
jgi:hypothetical protein